MTTARSVESLRLIAGTSLAFTHPNALTLAEQKGWSVRLGSTPRGIFHPKVIIGGGGISGDGTVSDSSIMYVGSANLTRPAMEKNTECGILFRGDCVPADCIQVFQSLWQAGSELTPEAFQQYSSIFTRRNRRRTSRDLQDFGVTDAGDESAITLANLRDQQRPTHGALRHQDADTVWVGLQTSTGEFSFQPEFPRVVGDMVLRIIESDGVQLVSHGSGNRERLVADVQVLCSDGQTRPMTFTYYRHNSMRRLNIPNEVPNAEWARANRDGIAVLSKSEEGPSNLTLEIVRAGEDADEYVRRSFVLGTWGVTPTRAYGWF